MIIDTSQGNIETYGDIKEFKTSIDPKNLEFITTLLSSNLYSDPEQSFIREIVSNAWDSHVEAGTTDTPVIVKFSKDGWNNNRVMIRDYGTGLSPERFENIFCNIGSSTKRESNAYIGGFGIGRFSALACSNTVYITSYYEGVAYYYVMVKNGNQITTNLLMEKPTLEKNGVEITIKSIPELGPYVKALDYIVFFPNVYVDCPGVDLNSAKLKRFTNFAATTICTKSKLLLGNVLYPCNDYLLDTESMDFLKSIANTGIVIKFEVGEINITPNRESIIYTSDTIKKIKARIKAAKDELNKMIDAKLAKDYDNLDEYYNAISTTVYYNPVADETTTKYGVGYRVDPINWRNTHITYKGTDLRGYANYINLLMRTQLPNLKCVVYNNKLYQKNYPWMIRNGHLIRTNKIVMLESNTKLLSSIKVYLRENWEEYAVITYLTLDEFKDYLKGALKEDPTLKDTTKQNIIIEGAYEALLKKAKRVDLNTNSIYLSVKESMSSSNLGTVPTRETILYIYDSNVLYRTKKEFRKFSQALDFIKGLKKGVILANMDTNENPLWEIAKLRGFVLIKARKDIVSSLRALDLSCLVDIDWLMKDDPVLRIVAAINKSFPNGLDTDCIDRLCNTIPSCLSKEFIKVGGFYHKYVCSNHSYSVLASQAASEGRYDQYTAYICELMKKYIQKYKEVEEIVSSAANIYQSALITAVIVRKKVYMVSSHAYEKMKDNKLLNVLCKR